MKQPSKEPTADKGCGNPNAHPLATNTQLTTSTDPGSISVQSIEVWGLHLSPTWVQFLQLETSDLLDPSESTIPEAI